jgi:hypothetical protein
MLARERRNQRWWVGVSDRRLRERVERYFVSNPDASVTDALGALTLAPARQELVKEVRAERRSDVPAPETRVVHRNEPYDVYIGRGDGGDAHLSNTEIGETGWLGNPYHLDGHGGVHTREQSLARYCQDVLTRVETDPAFAAALAELKRNRLACYCRHASESEPDCHGDVLVQVIGALRPVGGGAGTEGGESA